MFKGKAFVISWVILKGNCEVDRFLISMEVKPRFYKDPDVTVCYCYSLLPSVPGTAPAQGYLCGSQCLQLCWGQEQAFLSIGMCTVNSVQGTTKWCSEQCGAGAVTVTVPANNRAGS